eukprot:IDg1762t1
MEQVFKERLHQSVKSVVGAMTKPVDGNRNNCRARECEMGNLVCAAMLAFTGPRDRATLCVQNGGGLRASLDKGDVTIEEVLSVLPFGNVHAIGGMKLVADFSAPPGSRVRSVVVNGVPIIDDKMYTVVTNAFWLVVVMVQVERLTGLLGVHAVFCTYAALVTLLALKSFETFV